MVGFPNNHWFEPPKNDQYLGCEMGGFPTPPFKETPIYVIRIVASFQPVNTRIGIHF